MAAVFASPYLDLGQSCAWLRGNGHGHSTVSDGTESPEALVDGYAARGYAYLALSEHDQLLDPEPLSGRTSLCLVPAVEVTSAQGQTLLHLGARRALPASQLTARQILQAVEAEGGLFVFDHPNWRPRPDYATDGLLETMAGLRGLEIYCGVIERLAGEALATDRWDRLLSKGWRVFGHATDDQHVAADRFVAWNCVQWPAAGPAPDAEGIVAALASGRFYASTGVTILWVGVDPDGQRAVVESDADEVRWVSTEGRIVKKERGGRGGLTLEELVKAGLPQPWFQGRSLYARAECLGRGAAAAWTQPFWLAGQGPPAP